MSLEDRLNAAGQIEDLQQSLVRTQRQLAKAKDKNELMLGEIYRAMQDAIRAAGVLPKTSAPKLARGKGKEEAALWDMGDWQLSKKTTTYNSQVAQERVMLFCDKAFRITEVQRSDHAVRDCHIIFGGDMLEGLFNFPSQVFEIDQTLFGQFVTTSHLMVKVVKFALAAYRTVTVTAEHGNHGRIGSKRDAVPGSDNMDRMAFEMSRQLLQNEPRLTWIDTPDDIKKLEIGNYRALVCHGDEIGRGGAGSPSTLIRHADRWKSGAFGWDFRDVYFHHWHNHAEYPMANGQGSVFITGSTESDNRYARDGLSASATPSQRLHFIDPDKGRITAQYKVFLDTK